MGRGSPSIEPQRQDRGPRPGRPAADAGGGGRRARRAKPPAAPAGPDHAGVADRGGGAVGSLRTADQPDLRLLPERHRGGVLGPCPLRQALQSPAAESAAGPPPLPACPRPPRAPPPRDPPGLGAATGPAPL